VNPATEMELPLANGGFAIIDVADHDRVKKHTWRAYKFAKGKTYVVRSERTPKGPRLVYLHRELMDAKPDQFVDHRNHNGLDCARQRNLRFATMAENNQNRRKFETRCGKPATSQFKGVSAHRGGFQVHCGGVYLGHFPNEKEAAHAYDTAALKQFGEFAKINFPQTIVPTV
jgi:hypothetical protein